MVLNNSTFLDFIIIYLKWICSFSTETSDWSTTPHLSDKSKSINKSPLFSSSTSLKSNPTKTLIFHITASSSWFNAYKNSNMKSNDSKERCTISTEIIWKCWRPSTKLKKLTPYTLTSTILPSPKLGIKWSRNGANKKEYKCAALKIICCILYWTGKHYLPKAKNPI